MTRAKNQLLFPNLMIERIFFRKMAPKTELPRLFSKMGRQWDAQPESAIVSRHFLFLEKCTTPSGVG